MIGQKFIITNAGWRNNRQIAYFNYNILTDEKTFELEETLEFSQPAPESFEVDRLMQALHIALAISYYKSFIPPIIEHPYNLTDEEAQFWNSVYKNGLGEYLYKNSISSSKLASFTAQSGLRSEQKSTISWNDSVSIGIGGGKDSIVAGELLKGIDLPLNGFVLATGEILGQTKAVADAMGISLSAVKRKLDPQILEINNIEGAYNGHIPISLIFGLVGTMISVMNQSRYVVVANEASASIPQTKWENQNINHQWSKSLEFEQLFQNYLNSNVSNELFYFSAVRPLTSVAIAKIFSQYNKYFEIFTSDNSLFKINQEAREHPRWSPNSSKSLSSFILLAPWTSDEDLISIFGQNYLYKQDLIPMLSALLGEDNQTVLDCVGTSKELASSLAELVKQDRFTDSALLTYTKIKKLLENTPDIQSFMVTHEHAIPEAIAPKILKQMELRV